MHEPVFMEESFSRISTNNQSLQHREHTRTIQCRSRALGRSQAFTMLSCEIDTFGGSGMGVEPTLLGNILAIQCFGLGHGVEQVHETLRLIPGFRCPRLADANRFALLHSAVGRKNKTGRRFSELDDGVTEARDDQAGRPTG